MSYSTSAVKVIEVEEKFDLVFSRPLGYVFALVAKSCRLTPTQVSLLSMIAGVLGGYYLYFQNNIVMISWGCLLLVIAGVLDSSDGILARMTQKTSHLGYIIDGFIDNIVFLSAYLGGTIYLSSIYGWQIFIVAMIAGAGHSIRALIYKIYIDDCAYLFGDQESLQRPEPLSLSSLSDQRGIGAKILYYLYHDQTRKQWLLGTRSSEMYQQFKAFKKSHCEQFKEKYKSEFVPLLTLWALVGGCNIHRFLIMGFSLMGHFEWFLYTGILLNIPTLVIWLIQRYRDRRFLAEMGLI
tara:strand:- start:875 stop:1759 length:885 start_codon:yes stop_codon:yes gene_type:complete